MAIEYTLDNAADEARERYEELLADGWDEEQATMIMRGKMSARMDRHETMMDESQRDVEF